MYLPEHFSITDEDEIFSFLETHSFGQIISKVNERIFATHLPFLVNREKNQLLGHLAKQNSQHREIVGQEVLVTFQGPHDYVSPSWFTKPGVPTWNYQAVHVYGSCRVIHEPERVAEIVNTLTAKHESVFVKPWQPEYKAAMLSAIVGIEISIDEIQCKYKLSQNRVQQDQVQIKENLHKLESTNLADAMQINE